MKTIKLFGAVMFLAIAASFAITTQANPLDPNPQMYHYGFILSCGQTVHRSFDHELTTQEIIQWTDFFEDTICAAMEKPGFA